TSSLALSMGLEVGAHQLPADGARRVDPARVRQVDADARRQRRGLVPDLAVARAPQHHPGRGAAGNRLGDHGAGLLASRVLGALAHAHTTIAPAFCAAVASSASRSSVRVKYPASTPQSTQVQRPVPGPPSTVAGVPLSSWPMLPVTARPRRSSPVASPAGHSGSVSYPSRSRTATALAFDTLTSCSRHPHAASSASAWLHWPKYSAASSQQVSGREWVWSASGARMVPNCSSSTYRPR